MDLIWLKVINKTPSYTVSASAVLNWKSNKVLSKMESFFLALQFSGWNLYKVLQSSQILPVHWVAEFPASKAHTNKISQTSMRTYSTRTNTHTHTQCRITMDHSVPRGPNQLGQVSEMYSLAKALQPYLHQYPTTAKLSVPCIVLCCSVFISLSLFYSHLFT